MAKSLRWILCSLLVVTGSTVGAQQGFETGAYDDLVDGLESRSVLQQRQWLAPLGARFVRDVMRSRRGIFVDLNANSALIIATFGVHNVSIRETLDISFELAISGNHRNAYSDWVDGFLPLDERNVPSYGGEEDGVGALFGGVGEIEIDGTKFQFDGLPASSFDGDVTLFNHLQIGGGLQRSAYIVWWDPDGDMALLPEERRLEFTTGRIEVNILDIGSLLGLPSGGNVELLNEVSVSDSGAYQGTDTIYRTGVWWMPAVEIAHYPQQDSLWIGSLYVDVPLPGSFLMLKSSVANVSPWFAEIDAFLDFAPIYYWLSNVQSEDTRDNDPEEDIWGIEHHGGVVEARRAFLADQPGTILNVGVGLRHTRMFPYAVEDTEIENTGYYGLLGVASRHRFADRLEALFFFNLSVQSQTLGTINEIIDLDNASQPLTARVDLGLGVSF